MNESHKQKMIETRNKKFLDKINNQLRSSGINLEFVFYTSAEARLNNGRILRNREIKKFVNRSRNKKFLEFMENLYCNDTEISNKYEKEIMRHFQSEGGKLTHIIHGENLYKQWKGRSSPRKGKTGFKGVPCTEENKRKLSSARMGSGNPNWGKSPSLETREKQSTTTKNKILNN